MAQQKEIEFPKINLPTFIGGMSVDLKNGINGSHYQSLAMDFRQKASQMTILPGLKNIATNTQLSDRILCMEQDLNGFRYGVGHLGYVYEINKSNVVSQLGQLDGNGGAGMAYSPLNDNLYMSAQRTVSLYGQCTQMSPQLSVGHFGPSASVAPAVIYTFNTTTNSYDGNNDANNAYSAPTGYTNTMRNNLNSLTATGITPSNYSTLVTNNLTNFYNPGTSVLETAGNYCAFVPDIEPFYAVAVYLLGKGTGNLTLTMHDTMNNNLGSVTVANASLPSSGWVLFTFSAQIRAFVNQVTSNTTSTGYHFHITDSVSSDTNMKIATINSSKLDGANFVLFADRLVATHNGWHPMTMFNQYLVVGNGNYVSTYNFGNDSDPNNSQWVRHQLLLDVGYEVTGVSNAGQYLVVTAARFSTDGTRQYQGGYIYYWDGINNGFNDKVPIPYGAPYSPQCFNNVVYFYCSGSFFAYVPGSPTINKVRYIGYQNTDFLNTSDTTIVNPNMMTSRYGLLLMGYPSSTTNTNLNMGIYTWGAVELIYPNSFGYSYLPSTQMQTASGQYQSNNYTNYQIGMIENFVDTLYMSYSYVDHNGTTQYMLDLLDNTCGLAPNFNFTCLMWDGGVRYKYKEGLRLKINFTNLPANVTLKPWYSIDRGPQMFADPKGTSYAVNGSNSVAVTTAFINIPYGRGHEFQWGFTGAVTGTVLTSPAITGISFEVNPLPDEMDLKPDTSTNGVGG